MSFSNVYDDAKRAEAYARLDFPGTYALAFRDLGSILKQHASGERALDFGCGAGRSTRFLQRLGFATTGIDISSSMIELARRADPAGRYLLVPDGDLSALRDERFDAILSAFAFDNIPGREHRRRTLAALRDALDREGRIVILGSRPEIYTHEWASFTTKDFPENARAKGGEEVRIVMKDVPDARPVVDLLWTHEDYLDLFTRCGLRLVAQHAPLGRDEEPYSWISETRVAPWIIYVLARA